MAQYGLTPQEVVDKHYLTDTSLAQELLAETPTKTLGDNIIKNHVHDCSAYHEIYDESRMKYTVTVSVSSLGGSGTVDIKVDDVSKGTSYSAVKDTVVTLVATPVAGGSFDGWNDGDTNATRQVTITDDKEYKAAFTLPAP